MADDALASFPTYAELTRSPAWASTIAPLDQADLTIDQVIATETRYSEGALLGSGGMGEVILTRDARIGRDVAVKQLRDDRDHAANRARFLFEARVQGQLEHPSIVPVYDIDVRPDGSLFFTMRRVIGRTLYSIIDELKANQSGRYTERELLTAFATVCLAIDYAHSRGVIHRDLKPANIMLGDFGEVYVLDWGLAQIVNDTAGVAAATGERLSTPGAILGTPLYMAPEQIEDPTVGPAADVFSLGAILFELLAYESLRDPRAPFVPAEARASTRVPARGVAPELEAICLRATHDEPAARYPTARALHDAVARYLEGDRELELRRARASEHASAARAALARAGLADDDAVRGVAMRELGRAIAFDPQNREYVAMLAEIMRTPPRQTPPEVERQIDAAEQSFLRAGARAGSVVSLALFIFFPAILAIGVIRFDEAAVISALFIVGATLAWVASRRPVISIGLQYTIFAVGLIAIMSVSRLFGPLVLVPMMMCAYTMGVQIHPRRSVRRAVVIMACVALTLTTLLDVAGVLPSSYLFEGGRITIVPQMLELTRTGSLVVLLLGTFGQTLTGTMFIARLRDRLTEAERLQLIQAWHFRRLGDELMSERVET